MTDPRDLTEEQEKAWKSLQRAFKKCENANILWYQVLDTLSPLNGNIASSVETHDFCNDPDNAFSLEGRTPDKSVKTTCGFADDELEHYVILK